MLLGAWWDLLLSESEECDVALEAKLRTKKADVIVECEGITFEGLLPCFEEREGVTKLLFLVSEGLHKISELKSFLIWWSAYFVLGAR